MFRLTGTVIGSVVFSLFLLYLWGSYRMAQREPDSGIELPPSVPGRLILVNGHRVHVIDRGAGPAVLLVHGTAGSTFDWEQTVMDPLAHRHRVIAVDLFGMGFSERSADFSYGFALWADQLAGTLDALGVARASVVGHSLGGAVALVFAGNYPQKVDRLISVDSGPWLPPFMLLMMTPGAGEMMMGCADYWPHMPSRGTAYEEGMRMIYEIKGTRRALLKSARGQILESPSGFRAFRRINAPTLLLHGGSDPIIPASAAALLLRIIPGSRMVVVDGAGHFLMNDKPNRFVAEVENFLDQDTGSH